MTSVEVRSIAWSSKLEAWIARWQNLSSTSSKRLNTSFCAGMTKYRKRPQQKEKAVEKELKNDIHANELRFGSSSRFNKNRKWKLSETSVNNPTPVTLISIMAGKKNRSVI